MSDSDGTDILGCIGIVIAIVIGLALYFVPTIIAVCRGHTFKWVIFALNFVGGWTGIFWVVALVWAVWPSKTVFSDVLTHDPTGLSGRNVGTAGREIRDEYYK